MLKYIFREKEDGFIPKRTSGVVINNYFQLKSSIFTEKSKETKNTYIFLFLRPAESNHFKSIYMYISTKINLLLILNTYDAVRQKTKR